MKILLAPFYLLYQTGAVFRNFLYDRHLRPIYKAPLPVISVGNIAFGGSEKTPLARFLLHFFSDLGFKPALISRGYKGRWEKKGGVVADGRHLLASWEEAGDEPYMIAREFPSAGVFVGYHRFLSCQRAYELGFNLAILDDGFQHRQLARNLDIVLFHLSHHNSFARREPISSLSRADIILLKKELSRTPTASNQPDLIKKLVSNFRHQKFYFYEVQPEGFFTLQDDSTLSADFLRSQRTIAFCGIAAPHRFFSLLRQEGVHPEETLCFPDHFPYSQSAIKKIIKLFKEKKADYLCTTEKDAVKLTKHPEFANLPLVYLKIKIKVDQEFCRELSQRVQSWVR